MAISALDQMNGPTDKALQRAGAATFIIVVAKSIIEAATGHIVFESFHLGSLGTPVAVCHAGGVLGGLVVMVIVRVSGTILASRTTTTRGSVSKFRSPAVA
jgi:hypothetical protein